MDNIFDSIPTDLEHEIFEDLLNHEVIRIERIISKGQTSPATGWYDQEENEWLMLLQGEAVLGFEDGR